MSTPYPVMPDGTMALFLSPHGVMVGGPQSMLHEIPILAAGTYFGIWFYPGSFRLFFDLDVSDMRDQLLDGSVFVGSGIGELHERIYSQSRFRDRVTVCDQWLLRQIQPRFTPQFEFALDQIYRSRGDIRIGQLAKEMRYSSRHLNRLFQHHVGYGPKMFAQTIRIQHACRSLFQTASTSIDTAMDLGFVDQAHLINEFKKRLLSTPRAFMGCFGSDFYNH
ncbi:MAG: helix-turn-helix domain-containing protein [Halothiobacillus sp.]|nr:helix-turn-helix domain-containing protein [Halothiobacillus sp.]